MATLTVACGEGRARPLGGFLRGRILAPAVVTSASEVVESGCARSAKSLATLLGWLLTPVSILTRRKIAMVLRQHAGVAA